MAIFCGFAAGCGQVDSGEAGFFTRWGEITSKQPLDEGLHFYEPFGTELVTYDIKNQTTTVNTEVFTKDVQSMTVALSVTYNLDPAKVIELHRTTGRKYVQVLIQPSVLGAVKDALGKMEADQIVGKREVATKSIQDTLVSKLAEYGIRISLVNIANIDYSDAFERAVEEKQVAQQQAIKEKNNTQRLKEVAEQEVIKAEAEAKATLAKARAEAESIEIRNKALASSHALIEYETIKTWDGKLPVQMLGSAPIPFIDIVNKKIEVK